jgi:S-adenosylmethionine uptake transporter
MVIVSAFAKAAAMARPETKPAIPFAVASLGIAVFSVMDVLMKDLSISIGAYNAMLWRCMIGAVIGGTIFFARRLPLPPFSTLSIHIIRGVLAAAMATLFFWGLARVPLAEAVALSFIAPLITLYLAAILLKEQIGRNAIVASILGIAGVLVILGGKMGGKFPDDARWGVAAIFLSAVLYAFNLILQRQQAQVAKPLEIAFFQSLIAASALALGAPWFAVVPAAEYFPALTGSAMLAFVSLTLLSWAYARAEAQILVAVEYTAFIWAALFGWFFFDEAVTRPTILGTALIVTGCIIAARQKPQHIDHVETATI